MVLGNILHENTVSITLYWNKLAETPFLHAGKTNLYCAGHILQDYQKALCQSLLVDNTFTFSSLSGTCYFAHLSNFYKFLVRLHISSTDSHETDLIVYTVTSRCYLFFTQEQVVVLTNLSYLRLFSQGNLEITQLHLEEMTGQLLV